MDVKELILYVTSRCNLDCSFCYIDRKHKYESPLMLSKEQLVWVKKNINAKKVFLMGGEPLLYPHLKTALQLFKNVTISTNSLLVEKNISLIKRFNVSLQLSIEGSREETNMTRGKDVWEKVIDTAKLCKKNGVNVFFRSGLWYGNLKSLSELLEVGRKLDVPVVLFPRIDKRPLEIGEQVYIFDKALEYDAVVAVPNFFQYIGKHQGRCSAGSERISIFYDGKITPCQMDFDYILGKVGDNIEAIEKMRDVFVKNFRKCPLECIGCPHSKVCKGGCYVCKYYFGCPLRRRIDIGHFMSMHDMSKENVDVKADKLVDFMRDVVVC